jgi:glycosyltransferase involved in cell wall biosynthesis
MTFVIITHVPHINAQRVYSAYGPYVREINIWIKQVDKVIIVAPRSDVEKTVMDLEYSHQNIEFVTIPSFDLLSLKAVFRSIIKMPQISWCIYTALNRANHIHLRCPGNIGLLGAIIQIAFPLKPKTAKYAGNWDPQSKQPWSYRLQKWILSNTFLTRNMRVLVYGEWPNQSKNIKSLFTATYSEMEKLPVESLNLKGNINFVFVGSLVKGKNPLYAIQLVEALIKKGHQVALSLYGEGVEKESLQEYINKNNLESNIVLKGNQNQEVIKKAYQESHFVILASKSEGWPKAIAEGMFWGCVPLVNRVSCVPFMLDDGKRGILMQMDLYKDLQQIELLFSNQRTFYSKCTAASTWSRKYTIEVFEQEIGKLLLKVKNNNQ